MELLNIPRKLLQNFPVDGIPYYYRLKAYKNWKASGEFRKRPDPFKIIFLDPNKIVFNSGKRFSYIGNRSMYADCGKIEGGDWDLSTSEFKRRTIYEAENPEETIFQTLELRFKEGYEWEKTPIIRDWLKKVKNNETAGHNCKTEADIYNRCKNLDNLYTEITSNGYLSKKEILSKEYQDPMKKVPGKNPALFKFLYDEVVVNIGRTGEFLFVGGHHRLSMAQLAGIEKIPVRIFVRHEKWQQLRDRIYTGKEMLEDGAHPDLNDVT